MRIAASARSGERAESASATSRCDESERARWASSSQVAVRNASGIPATPQRLEQARALGGLAHDPVELDVPADLGLGVLAGRGAAALAERHQLVQPGDVGRTDVLGGPSGRRGPRAAPAPRTGPSGPRRRTPVPPRRAAARAAPAPRPRAAPGPRGSGCARIQAFGQARGAKPLAGLQPAVDDLGPQRLVGRGRVRPGALLRRAHLHAKLADSWHERQ